MAHESCDPAHPDGYCVDDLRERLAQSQAKVAGMEAAIKRERTVLLRSGDEEYYDRDLAVRVQLRKEILAEIGDGSELLAAVRKAAETIRALQYQLSAVRRLVNTRTLGVLGVAVLEAAKTVSDRSDAALLVLRPWGNDNAE